MIRSSGWQARSLIRPVVRLGDPSIGLLVVLAVGCSIAYKFALRLCERAAEDQHAWSLPVMAVALASCWGLAAWHRRMRFAAIWAPLRVLLRTVAMVIFVQIAIDALFPASVLSNLFIGIYPDARLLIGLALAAGLLGMARPAFLLPMFLAYCLFRYRAPLIFHVHPTALDFTTIVDVGQFTIAGLIVWWSVRRLPSRHLPPAFDRKGTFARFQKLLWGIAVGVHLGNYFHSAIAKVRVGGSDPFYWITDNPTAQSIATGLFRDNNPLGGWPELVGGYYDGLVHFALPINIVVFCLQLLAPLSVLSRRLMIGFTLAFDAMHLGIYLSLGAFFFLWIATNVAILLSLRIMGDRGFTPALQITAIVTALLGYMSFFNAQLGWLDGVKSVRGHYVANLSDGRSADVPPAAFHLLAFQLGQGAIYFPAGQFQMRWGSNVIHRADWADAHGCGKRLVDHPQRLAGSLDDMRRMVLATDGFYRRHPWVRQLRLYYLYPHHMPSNPAFFTAYEAAPMAAIRSYSYIVESACLGVRDGRLEARVKARSEYRFNVAAAR